MMPLPQRKQRKRRGPSAASDRAALEALRDRLVEVVAYWAGLTPSRQRDYERKSFEALRREGCFAETPPGILLFFARRRCRICNGRIPPFNTKCAATRLSAAYQARGKACSARCREDLSAQYGDLARLEPKPRPHMPGTPDPKIDDSLQFPRPGLDPTPDEIKAMCLAIRAVKPLDAMSREPTARLPTQPRVGRLALQEQGGTRWRGWCTLRRGD